MTVYVYSKNVNENATVCLGPAKAFAKTFDATSYKHVLFFASVDDPANIPVINTLISNIYIDHTIIVQARKHLETLISQFKKSENESGKTLTSFNIWFSFRVPYSTNAKTKEKTKLIREPIHNYEIMLSDANLSDDDINHIVTDMAEKQFPVIAQKLDPLTKIYEEISPYHFRESIYLSFYPPS